MTIDIVTALECVGVVVLIVSEWNGPPLPGKTPSMRLVIAMTATMRATIARCVRRVTRTCGR